MLHPSLYRWAYASSLQLHGVPSSLFIVVCPHALFAGCCKILIGQVAFAQVLELYSMFYTTCFSPQTYNLMPTTALLSFKLLLKLALTGSGCWSLLCCQPSQAFICQLSTSASWLSFQLGWSCSKGRSLSCGVLGHAAGPAMKHVDLKQSSHCLQANP